MNLYCARGIISSISYLGLKFYLVYPDLGIKVTRLVSSKTLYRQVQELVDNNNSALDKYVDELVYHDNTTELLSLEVLPHNF